MREEWNTYTSRTTSGSMSVRSSLLSSLQQMPSALECLAHFEGNGMGCIDCELSIGHTGGFCDLTVLESGRFGSRTEGPGWSTIVTSDAEDIERTGIQTSDFL